MKYPVALALCVACSTALSQNGTFLLGIPSIHETNTLTSSMFEGADAVILCKQQGYTEGPHSSFDGFTLRLTNEVAITSQLMMVKLFNETAVNRFGSFEYEYPETRGRGPKHVLTVRARVVKPDSTVWVLPDSAISIVTGATNGDGDALTKKVLFKIPNLAPGDIVQIEYSHLAPFSFHRRVMFWYHDRYPILQSNVLVTMPRTEKVDFMSFPSKVVGEGQLVEHTKEIARSWSVRNLAAIPPEVFSRPFDEVSYLTAMVNHTDEDDGDAWRPLAKQYWKYYINDGSVPKSFMRELGLDPSLSAPTTEDVDRAYTAIRKYFRLSASNENVPDNDGVDRLIEDKEGDASDLAFILLKILERWDVHALPVLIRDRREGAFEPTVATTAWFDRMGVFVSLPGGSNIYDFDRSIPTRYEYPWFLNGIRVVGIADTGAVHFAVHPPSNVHKHISEERHRLEFSGGGRLNDSLEYTLRGALAQHLRKELYPLKGQALFDKIRTLAMAHSLKEADTVSLNNFLDDPSIRLGAAGRSQAETTTIDSFLIVHPKNHLLRTLRLLFPSTERKQDIFLDEPFIYTITWDISVPHGYIPAELPAPVDIHELRGLVTQVTYFIREGVVTAKADVLIDAAQIKTQEYKAWLAFLDDSMKAMEREIVFKRMRR